MIRLSKTTFLVIFICFTCHIFAPTHSRSLFRRRPHILNGAPFFQELNAAASDNGSTKPEPRDSCFEGRNTFFPCSSTITGNILLVVFYGLLLGVAAKCISDGAELLLDVGLSPALVGGLVLPLLGAVPDSAIIIMSGLGDDAQRKLSIGMGTLAGSTIMLLTGAWSGSVVLGRCNLNSHGEAIEQTGYNKFSCTKQGVTILPSVKTSVVIMLITSLAYFIVQGADWHFGATNFDTNQPEYIRKAALATMIICFICFVAYLVFLVVDSKSAQMRADKHQAEMMQRRVLRHFVLMAKRQMPERIGDSADGSPEQEAHVQKKYFKAWRLGAGLQKEPSETDPIIPKDETDDQAPLKDSFEMSEPEHEHEADEEESTTMLAIKSAVLLFVGVGMVTIFADPMCDVLDAVTNKNNKSFIPISAFYVSFVVTPLCSNASELLSSLIFASKKRKENISMTFSQLYGASTMNNTLCLGIFCALVYFRKLRWDYSAEVTVIILIQWLVGIIGFRYTYKVWMAGIVGALYVVSIGLVALLESPAVGWK